MKCINITITFTKFYKATKRYKLKKNVNFELEPKIGFHSELSLNSTFMRIGIVLRYLYSESRLMFSLVNDISRLM